MYAFVVSEIDQNKKIEETTGFRVIMKLLDQI